MSDWDDSVFDADVDLFDEPDLPDGARATANEPGPLLPPGIETLGDDDDVHEAAAAAAEPNAGPPITLPSRNGNRVIPVAKAKLLEQYRSHLLSGADIGRLPAPVPLVDGWLDRDSLAVLFGQPGAGKSFVALDLACSIASGAWWHGKAVTKGRVLYVVAEGAYALGPRLAAWLTAGNYYQPSIVDELGWLVAAPNLFVRDDAVALAALALEVEPTLIIIDTLARCTGGADENSARDLGFIIANLDRLRDLTGAAVLVVHHTNRAGEHMRGHTALEAAVDTAIEVKQDDDGRVILESTKQKNRPDPPPLSLTLTPIGDSCALTQRAPTFEDVTLSEMPASYRKVLEFISESDLGTGLTATFIRDNAGAAKSSANRILNRLAKLELLHKDETGRSHRFRMTELGKLFLSGETVNPEDAGRLV